MAYLALCLNVPSEMRGIGMIGAVEETAIPDDGEIARTFRAIVAPIITVFGHYAPDAVAVALYESGQWKFEYMMPGMAARAPDWRLCRAAIVIEENGDSVIRRRDHVTGFRLWG